MNSKYYLLTVYEFTLDLNQYKFTYHSHLSQPGALPWKPQS